MSSTKLHLLVFFQKVSFCAQHNLCLFINTIINSCDKSSWLESILCCFTIFKINITFNSLITVSGSIWSRSWCTIKEDCKEQIVFLPKRRTSLYQNQFLLEVCSTTIQGRWLSSTFYYSSPKLTKNYFS